jgi:hypothetical protein
LLDSFDEIKALLSSVGLDDRVRAYAEAIEQFAHVLADFVRNPLFLALICAFRQIERRLPKTLDEAFDGFVTRRLERDERRFLDMGLDLTRTCDGASAVALRMLLVQRAAHHKRCAAGVSAEVSPAGAS